MAEGQSGYSLADIGIMMLNNRNNGYGYGDGAWGCGGGAYWMFFIFFIFLFWGGNGAWGNQAGLQGALTRSDLNEGFNSAATHQKLDNVMLQNSRNTYELDKSITGGFYSINNNLMENKFAAQQCCCETNRNIDAVRYENARNTCDIIQAANANTQRILDTLCEDRIQDLRDKLAEKNQLLQTASIQISQEQQSANLINTLRPTPIPAYLTCSPYQSYNPQFGTGYSNGFTSGFNTAYGNGLGGIGLGLGTGFGVY